MEMSASSSPDRQRDLWLCDLRTRMVGIARKRVEEDDVEDVVQSALRVVVERGLSSETDRVEEAPALAWCFQVLRNTIGNHYTRQRTRRAHLDEGVDTESVQASISGSSSQSTERLAALERALEELENSGGQCAELLRRSLDGMSPREIADEKELELNALYQRLYRCRRQFRELLRERGVLQ
jgi:RNA polymerase sigma factor (sigma-70 family)